MRLRLTLRALGDLESIASSIRSENPPAAQRVRNEIQKSFLLLTAYPHAGRSMVGGRRRLPVRRFPYLIYYRVDEAAGLVLVLTVRHAAREPYR